MLKSIIDATRLDPAFCAGLVGVSPEQFGEWLTGKPVPRFALPELSAILGVAELLLANESPASQVSDTASLAPAIWYKLRSDRLTSSDREMVGLIRKLGSYVDQLVHITGSGNRLYESLLSNTRLGVPKNAPPANQGRQAASAFRELTGIAHGQTAIGDQIRPLLRRHGVLVVESPLKNSNLEGAAFLVGPEGRQRPCIFVNTYKTTWFRRNELLLHELAHVIFDVLEDQVAVDYRDEGIRDAFEEQRADMFAQECLVPQSLLLHLAARLGLTWNQLSAVDLARLMADTHVEKRLLLKAANEANLISGQDRERYLDTETSEALRAHTDRALSTKEFLQKMGLVDSPVWRAENRNTEGIRRLRLPVGYVDIVLEANRSGRISESKAAEMLMLERRTYRKRFGEPQLVT
jgi:Zn-dependent peptidase ImmA (M78 family)